jgi:Flp pilus assembly protein TadG
MTRLQRLRRLGERLRDDRGSLSMAVVIWTPIVMVLCAFVVDIGFLISNRERANDLAEQAARRVADQIDEGVAHEHPGVLRIDVDPNSGACYAVARRYFTDTGSTDSGNAHVLLDAASLTCQVDNNPSLLGVQPNPGTPTRITVTIHMTYKPLFTGFLTGDSSTVTATGYASPISVG